MDLAPGLTLHERVVDCPEWLTTTKTPPKDAAFITDFLTREAEARASASPLAPEQVSGFRPFFRDPKAPLPAGSSNVYAPAMQSAAGQSHKRLSFWHTDVLLMASKP